jgi:hypothetical protein
MLFGSRQSTYSYVRIIWGGVGGESEAWERDGRERGEEDGREGEGKEGGREGGREGQAGRGLCMEVRDHETREDKKGHQIFTAREFAPLPPGEDAPGGAL